MEVQICAVAHGSGLGSLDLFMRTHVGTALESDPSPFQPGDMAVVKIADTHVTSLLVQLLLMDGKKTVAVSPPTDLYRTLTSSVVAVGLLRTRESMAEDPSELQQQEWGTLRVAWSWRRADAVAAAGPGWQQPVSGSGLGGSGWKNSKQLYSHTASTTQWLPSPRAIRTAIEKISVARASTAKCSENACEDPTEQADNSESRTREAASVYQFPIRFIGPKEVTPPRRTTPRRVESAKGGSCGKGSTPAVVQRLYPQQEQQRVDESPQNRRDESSALTVVKQSTGAVGTTGDAKQQRPATGKVKPPSARLCPRAPSDPMKEIQRLQRRMEELQADRRKVEGLSQRTSALDSLFTGP
jgi:hypothetical protein